MRDRALAFVRDLKLELPERPVDEAGAPIFPRLPSDVTQLSFLELGRLHGHFVAVASYADAEMGLIDIDHTEADHEADVTFATVGLQTEGNATERKFLATTNPMTRAKQNDALVKRAKKVMLAKLIQGYERAIAALSREQTRREKEMEKTP